MSLARLLALSVLLCALPALGQDRQPEKSSPSDSWSSHRNWASPHNWVIGDFFFFVPMNPAATAAEPWRIIPNQSVDRSGQGGMTQIPANQFNANSSTRPIKLDGQYGTLVWNTPPDADTTCYTIRSYVVARDSKDSDSTHPAGYSTCLASDRYHVKTADVRAVVSDR